MLKKSTKILNRIFLLIYLALLSFSAYAAIDTDLVIQDYTLVSKQRVGRTIYEYTYSVDLLNQGVVGYTNTVGTVTSSNPNTVITDAIIAIGSMNAASTKIAVDTFKLRQDRRFKLNKGSIKFSFTGDEVPNTPPFASAGSNQLVRLGSQVVLDGSNSSDNETSIFSYQWSFLSKPVGSSATISSQNSATPNFIADFSGRYLIQLIVNDGIENSDPSQVSINTVTGDVDVNFDNDMSSVDQEIIEFCFGADLTVNTGCSRTDLNGDGLVNTGDLEIIGYALPRAATDPDLTNDGIVDNQDIDLINTCINEIPTENINCQISDVNGDNYVDLFDLNMISSNLSTNHVFLNTSRPTAYVTDIDGSSYSLKRLVVKVTAGSTRTMIKTLAASVGGNLSGFIGNNIYIFSVNTSSIPELETIISTLEANLLVQEVSKDYRSSTSSLFNSDLDNLFTLKARRSFDTVLAEKGWELYHKVAQNYNLASVTVGIVDSTINTQHPEFNNVNIYQPISLSETGNHGTAIASLIGANISGSGLLTGIAQGALGGKLTIVSSPVFEVKEEIIRNFFLQPIGTEWREQGASIMDIVGGIHFAAQSDANIINISVQGNSCFTVPLIDPLVKLALPCIPSNKLSFWREVYRSTFNMYPSTLFVIASGNSGIDASNVIPASATTNNVLVVGSTNPTGDSESSFSNTGSLVDIVAPGEEIFVASGRSGSSPTQRYTEGTSFSSPIVASAAAILQSISPSLKKNPSLTKQKLIDWTDSPNGLPLLNVCRPIESLIVGVPQYGVTIPSNFCRVGNGNFENASALGWSSMGDFSVTSGLSSLSSITADQGLKMALLRSNGSTRANATDMEATFNLPSGSFDAVIGGTATVGSVAYQHVDARAGQTLSLRYNFINGLQWGNDFAFVVVCRVDQLPSSSSNGKCELDTPLHIKNGSVELLATANEAFRSTGNDHFKQTDWKSYSYIFPEAGEYIVAIGIMDERDVFGAHLLFVDSVDMSDD